MHIQKRKKKKEISGFVYLTNILDTSDLNKLYVYITPEFFLFKRSLVLLSFQWRILFRTDKDCLL